MQWMWAAVWAWVGWYVVAPLAVFMVMATVGALIVLVAAVLDPGRNHRKKERRDG